MKNKRNIIICLCMILCLLFCSCAEQNSKPKSANEITYTINESYNLDNLLSVTGKIIDVEASEYFDEFSINRGWAISYAGKFYDFLDSFNYGEGEMWNTYTEVYYFPDAIADRYEQAWEIEDEDEYDAAYLEISKDAHELATKFIVFGYIDSKDETNIAKVEDLIKDMDVIDFGTIDGNKYFMAFMKEMPQNKVYTSSDFEKMQEILDNKNDILDNYAVFPPVDDAADFSDFSALCADDSTITQDIFSEYDVTMINIWATWCDPCRAEMAELGRLYNMLPDGANLISFCGSDDGDENPNSVQDAIEEDQIPFTVIMPNQELKKKCLPNLIGYPSSIFVDKNGKMIDRLYVGAPTWEENKVADYYKSFIEHLLTKVK